MSRKLLWIGMSSMLRSNRVHLSLIFSNRSSVPVNA